MATGLSQIGKEPSSLRQFQLNGVIDTGRTVGDGSYATVKELEFRGLKCVGKKTHQVLFTSANPQERAALLKRFTKECELLSSLHHPNVVQFLGILFEDDSQLPVLVMEYLPTTLSTCLEKYGILSEKISYGILHDITLGLRYLHEHSPPIIHRDLSANNVLLTPSMSAKISDLGVAKILNITPAQMTRRMSTQAPGTPCYMPPEALMDRPTYTSKIDSYSYGVMIIHVLCGKWPFPSGAFRPDPHNPEVLIPVSEIDRRMEHLQNISQDHPLMGLIRQCLSNIPSHRPEASELQRQISTILSSSPEIIHHHNVVEMEERIQSLVFQNEALAGQNQAKQYEIEALRAENQLLSPQQRHRHRGSGQFSQPCSPLDSPLILLQPQAKVHWSRVASLPVKMISAQSVAVGENVYVGGGDADSHNDDYMVFQYNPAQDKWTTLPPCSVCLFGLGRLSGELLTVGGATADRTITNKVYRYKAKTQTWEEFLQPMPTSRADLSVISTQTALIACGGVTDLRGGKPVLCTTVEVFIIETSQWHITDPLPIPCMTMSSTTISNTGYLLGGVTTDMKSTKTVLYAPVASLIQNISHPKKVSSAIRKDSISSAWMTFRDTPLVKSTATSSGGMLLALGGRDDQYETLPAVHIYSTATSSWIRIESGDLPEPQCWSTAVGLSANRLLVVGGSRRRRQKTNTVFLGSVTFGF